MENESAPEYFLAFLIEKELVKAAIWTIEEEKARIIGEGEKETWNGESASELTESASLSLSSAISKLEEGEQKPPAKVILGLSDTWVKEGKILPEKLTLLKRLTTDLSLIPLGFVVESEAQAHFLKTNEGGAANAILINLEPWGIKITLILLGKVVGVEMVGRSDNLALDVEEGLLRFPQETAFPARIILSGEEDLEATKQTLLSYPWQEPEKKLSFLHFPKVELAPENFDILSLCLAGGTEIAKTTQVEEKEEEKLGFVKEKDILEEEEARPEETAKTLPPEPKIEAQAGAEPEPKKATTILNLAKKSLSLISKIRLPRPHLPSFSFGWPLMLAFGGTILAVSILGVLAFRFLTSARVVIFVSPQDFQRELQIAVSPVNKVLNEKTKTIPGEIVEVTVAESKTAPATGKKLVGEKAGGEVTIYNRLDSKKSFPAGTILIGPGQLKFTLALEVNVASKTADLASGVDRWGEAKATVSAADIGADYNLAANSQISLASFPTSSYLAKNPAPFSGGTSRQIQAVSEKDQLNLKNELEASLQGKAKKELEAKISAGKKLVLESLTTTTTKKEFDRKVGEETQTFSLNLELSASALAFAESELKDLSEKLLAGNLGNLTLNWPETTTEFKILKTNPDKSVLFRVGLKGKLYPKTTKEEVAKNLAGKSLDFAKNYLGSLLRVSGFEIRISPAFFSKLERLPAIPGKIKVEIQPR